MTKTSAVLRKLSLNAAKNWHQNNGAKRFDSRRKGPMLHYYKVPSWLRPEKRRPFSGRLNDGCLWTDQRRTLSSRDSTATAPTAKQSEIPMTIVNIMTHMAFLHCGRRI